MTRIQITTAFRTNMGDLLRRLLTLMMLLFLINTLFARTTKKDSTGDSFSYFLHDNDAFKFKNETDKYYSFGLFFGHQKLLSSESKLYKLLPVEPSNESIHFAGAELSVKGFTPIKNSDSLIQLTRPFAGLLSLNTYFTTVNKLRLMKFNLELGIRGPGSGAKQVQTVWHELTNKGVFSGWKNQLPHRWIINGYWTFALPVTLSKMVELIPESQVAIGNNNTYLQQALMLRFGLFNDISNSHLYKTTHGMATSRRKEAFITGNVFYRIVIVDATLNRKEAEKIGLGNLDKDNFIGGIQVKFHYQVNRFGLLIGYTKKTSDSNFTRSHSYGTIGFSHLI